MVAYAYLRKSALNPGVKDASWDVQIAAVREMAARHGDAESLILLSDWDKSGRLGADKRPGYAALLAAISGGGATAVYSYSLSRLARSVRELSRVVDECDQRGVAVRLYADHVDTSTASGRLLTHVLSSVAQFEADVASERTRAAYEAKRARGERVGNTPFYGDGEDEDAQAVLAAFDEAGSYSGAARLLNERGIPPRSGKRGWWPSSVAVVVQRIRPVKRTEKGVKAAGVDFILARLLRCPTCGTLLTGIRDRGDRVRYACRLGSVRPHPRVSITESKILPAIKDEVARLMTPDRAIVEQRGALERQALEERRKRVLDMYETGDIDREEKDRRLGFITKDLDRLDVLTEIVDIPKVDWSWSARSLNEVLRALFERIDLDAETFQPKKDGFVWRVPQWRA